MGTKAAGVCRHHLSRGKERQSTVPMHLRAEGKKNSLGTETVFTRRRIKRWHLLTVLQLSFIPT